MDGYGWRISYQISQRTYTYTRTRSICIAPNQDINLSNISFHWFNDIDVSYSEYLTTHFQFNAGAFFSLLWMRSNQANCELGFGISFDQIDDKFGPFSDFGQTNDSACYLHLLWLIGFSIVILWSCTFTFTFAFTFGLWISLKEWYAIKYNRPDVWTMILGLYDAAACRSAKISVGLQLCVWKPYKEMSWILK